jgi:hypothetical protein
MAEMGTIYTDGSETEWAFWYRLIRSRGMFMWTEPLGGLVIDHLAYSLAPTYHFGSPPRGRPSSGWIMPDSLRITSSKTRQGEVWVFSEDAKTGVAHIARGIDTSIRTWRRKPIKIISSTTAKSQKDAKDEADREIFESIVGAQEIEITINDVGLLVKQNKMAQLNFPDLDLVGNYFVVGVQSRAGIDGRSQLVRLREKGFAISKRIPTAPTLQKDPGTTKVSSSITAVVKGMPGIRWADSFVRATNEFGVPAGWDTAVFLATLLSICQQESSFHNVRQGSHVEWSPIDEFGGGNDNPNPRAQPTDAYHEAFANQAENPLIKYEAGVGPMQLTTRKYKEWADQYGWENRARVGEYDGGRWNPDSNIRAAARALVEKAGVAPRVDPTNADNIWIAVARYHGGSDNTQYVASVKGYYKNTYSGLSTAAVTTAETKNLGTERDFVVIGHGALKLDPNVPDEVAKAINFCMNRRGDAYLWGGPKDGRWLYDCSSLVTAAYAAASPSLRAVLDEPTMNHHGENTYTLFRAGRFQSISRDNLLPGDLVFFDGDAPEHVGMYLDDGMMVHDPHTGDVVRVAAIAEFGARYTGARRLVTWRTVPTQRTG